MRGNLDDELYYELFIDASPETVFDFFVEPRAMAQWIGTSHQLEARPGGAFRVAVSPGYVASGVYKVVDRPRRVVFTWGWEEAADPLMASLKSGESVVDIDLEPRDGGTVVRFRHSRLLKGTGKRHDERWSKYLSVLVKAAERR